MTVDGNEWSVPIAVSPDGMFGFGDWDSEAGDFTGWSYADENFSVNMGGVMDPDPSILYAIGVVDFGAPSVFGFSFTTPIIFSAVPNLVDASVSGGLTDATGNGVTITPTLTNDDLDLFLELQVAELSTGGPYVNMGVDVGPTVSGGPGASGALYTYGAFLAGPQPGPIGAWSSLRVRVGFSLTGGNDAAALTGFAQIVPEPSSMALAGIGAAALVWQVVRRRRRR
jgi:hypothetical protein